MNIRYVPYRQIDKQKWDRCINDSPNGLIYGRSFYLDAMTAGRWDAVVLGDYEEVMPLTWNRKFGFNYLYQPYFSPALGIFGGGTPQNEAQPWTDHQAPLSAFLGAIPPKFRYWDIDLNETNHPENAQAGPGNPTTLHTTRTNYFLPLNRPYDDLRKDYKRLARRMSQKAVGDGLQVIRQVSPAEVIGHYRKAYQHLHKIGDSHYDRLTKCADIALESGNAKSYLAQWPDGEIGAFYLVFSDDRFVYSVLGGSTPRGKENGAFYLLTDTVLRDHAGTERVFRFEGSDIPGIAFFDAQFGAALVHYPHLLHNNLPYPLRWLKH